MMFERWTERARQVVVMAQEAAKERNEDRIDSTMVLVGLIREQEGLAARLLRARGVTEEAVLTGERLREGLPPKVTPDGDRPPFTGFAEQALEYALREALSLGHNYVGTEHILLGLARADHSQAAQWLLHFGPDLGGTALHRAVESAIAPPGQRVEPEEGPTIRFYTIHLVNGEQWVAWPEDCWPTGAREAAENRNHRTTVMGRKPNGVGFTLGSFRGRPVRDGVSPHSVALDLLERDCVKELIFPQPGAILYLHLHEARKLV